MRYVILSLLSALLFGAATPASKVLLGSLNAFQLAGLLYLGAAIAMGPVAIKEKHQHKIPNITSLNLRRLFWAIIFGGILGPVLLLWGLRLASASSVSLWLNLEMVATLILGWLFFKDHLGRFEILGAAGILIASMLLGFGEKTATPVAGIFIGLACVCWGLDNHFTASIDGITPSQSTMWKGMFAGSTNLLIGSIMETTPPPIKIIAYALILGAFSYGISIALYIKSAQQIGASRSQMIFSTSPFFGVVLSAFFLGESLSVFHYASALLIAISVFAVFRDKHEHLHIHQELAHAHEHLHDDGHHGHIHDEKNADLRHSHWHEHLSGEHSHPHWPDLHHRHDH